MNDKYVMPCPALGTHTHAIDSSLSAASEEVEEGRLARAGRTHHTDHLARVEVDRYPLENVLPMLAKTASRDGAVSLNTYRKKSDGHMLLASSAMPHPLLLPGVVGSLKYLECVEKGKAEASGVLGMEGVVGAYKKERIHYFEFPRSFFYCRVVSEATNHAAWGSNLS